MLWLVRNKTAYYVESNLIEEPSSFFVGQSASRTVIGHDLAGRLYLFVAEANRVDRGLSIPDTVDLALRLNLVNAVNLDGGGSATFVVEGTSWSNFKDRCPSNPSERCERAVTSIVCVK
jgi:N-acetylglucosamine-1-phosphodiester alpha-N-acetylglucosaminidase